MNFTALTSALLALQFVSSVADVVTYNWRITNIFTEHDGVFLNYLGINDKPGDQALIDVVLGQEVEVRVTNQLSDPTCLHWHGMKQLGTQEMDGASEITQCTIPPNATMTYHFVPDKAGSFWWHSHHLSQYAFGLRGPMIVRPAELHDWEKDIDKEYIIQLGDLYHQAPVAVPIWDTIVINNRGRYNCTAAATHNFTNCTDVQPLSKIQFEAGKKYLLRLISMVALAPIEFSIDDHEFRVVAADADYLEPSQPINWIFINAGQRYDIVVEAKKSTSNEHINSFWMRAKGLHGIPWTEGTAENAGEGFVDEGLAIVSYDNKNQAKSTTHKQQNHLLHGTPSTAGTAEIACEGFVDEGSASSFHDIKDEPEPTTQKQQNLSTIPEFDFTPLEPGVLPDTPDDRMVVQFKMENGLGFFSIDGGEFRTFVSPVKPPLFSIAGGLKTEELPLDANARKIEFGKHIEVVLVNVKGVQHPIHMHSHSPYCVATGTAPLEQIFNNTLPPLNLTNPMTRDVYTVPPCTLDANGSCTVFGYTVLRFWADNPGVWHFHCHIEWHIAAGLSMLLVEGEEELQQKGVKSFSNSVLSVCGSNSSFSSSM